MHKFDRIPLPFLLISGTMEKKERGVRMGMCPPIKGCYYTGSDVRNCLLAVDRPLTGNGLWKIKCLCEPHLTMGLDYQCFRAAVSNFPYVPFSLDMPDSKFYEMRGTVWYGDNVVLEDSEALLTYLEPRDISKKPSASIQIQNYHIMLLYNDLRNII